MAKLNETLSKLFGNLGIDSDKVKAILENKSLQEIELDDETGGLFEQTYFTEQSALNNKKIREAIKAAVSKDYEKESETTIEDLLKTINADEDTKLSLNGKKYSDKIKAILAKASEGKGGADKKTYEDRIAALNAEMLKQKTDFDNTVNGINKERETEKLNAVLDGLLNGMPYANKKTDIATNILIAKSLLGAKLSEQKIVPKLVDGKISLLNEDGTEFYDKNKKVNYEEFAKATLLGAGLVDYTNTGTTPKPGTPPTPPTPPKQNTRASFVDFAGNGNQELTNYIQEITSIN